MDTTLTVHGMHCQACKTLITMELEEAGLDDKVSAIEMSLDEKQGIISLTSVIEEEVQKIKDIINSFDAYSVT